MTLLTKATPSCISFDELSDIGKRNHEENAKAEAIAPYCVGLADAHEELSSSVKL